MAKERRRKPPGRKASARKSSAARSDGSKVSLAKLEGELRDLGKDYPLRTFIGIGLQVVAVGFAITVQQLGMIASLCIGGVISLAGIATMLWPLIRTGRARLILIGATSLPGVALILGSMLRADPGREEQYDRAIHQLGATTPSVRGIGYLSLVDLLDSDDFRNRSLTALLQAIATEEERPLTAGAIQAIKQESIDGLSKAERSAALDLAIHLTKDLSGEEPEVEPRRRNVVQLLGMLLSGFKASGLDFSSMSLDGLKVDGCAFPGSNFNHSSLRDVEFTNCNLSGSRMIGGSMRAKFTRCNLRNVHFNPNLFLPSAFAGSDLRDARFVNYSLAEYNYRHYPGWAGVGSFLDARIEGLEISDPQLFVVLPGEGEMRERSGFLVGILRHRTPEGFRVGLSYGIRQPRVQHGASDSLEHSLTVPVRSLLFLVHKGDPDLAEDIAVVWEIVREQNFSEVPESLFDNAGVGHWLATGEVSPGMLGEKSSGKGEGDDE